MLKLLFFITVIVQIHTVCIGANHKIDTEDKENPREIAREGEFPFQASIQKDIFHECSAAIVGKRHLLTSARCVESFSPEEIVANVGQLDWRDVGNRIKIEKIKIHALIALVQTKQDIQYSYKVQPVNFPLSNHWSEETFKMSGWSFLSWKLEYEDVHLEPCESPYHLFESVFCIRTVVNRTGVDPYLGNLLVVQNGHLMGLLPKSVDILTCAFVAIQKLN